MGVGKMNYAKLTTNGRVTIPKSIREQYNIKPGSILLFELKGDYVIVKNCKKQPRINS
jgi:AbrB family looped-hinge helix DNA binding protein